MNRKQRACIVSGFSLMVLSLLFPPASVHNPGIPGVIGASDSPVSYGFLFTVKGKIDFGRLFVEWLLIVLTGGLVYLLRGPASPKPETRPLASERNWRRLFWLSIALYVLIVALGITSYSLFRKVRRLDAGIQTVKTIVGADLESLPNSTRPLPFIWVDLPDFIPVARPGTPPSNPPKPVGKLRPIHPVYTAETMQGVLTGRLETLNRIKEELDKQIR